jgi:hypothetical protein
MQMPAFWAEFLTDTAYAGGIAIAYPTKLLRVGLSASCWNVTRLIAQTGVASWPAEEEARRVLRESLDRQRPETLVDIAREIFGPKHGFNLLEHPRVTPRPPPDFKEK